MKSGTLGLDPRREKECSWRNWSNPNEKRKSMNPQMKKKKQTEWPFSQPQERKGTWQNEPMKVPLNTFMFANMKQ